MLTIPDHSVAKEVVFNFSLFSFCTGSVVNRNNKMHRWWYSDENNEKGDRAHSEKSRKSLNNRSSSPKQWRFTVLFDQSLNPYETIALVGNCDELGNWDNDHAVILKKEEGSFNDEIKT